MLHSFVPLDVDIFAWLAIFSIVLDPACQGLQLVFHFGSPRLAEQVSTYCLLGVCDRGSRNSENVLSCCNFLRLASSTHSSKPPFRVPLVALGVAPAQISAVPNLATPQVIKTPQELDSLNQQSSSMARFVWAASAILALAMVSQATSVSTPAAEVSGVPLWTHQAPSTAMR